MLERDLAGEVGGHHDHPGHPEEDDVVAGDQHAAGQVQVVVLCFFRPTHGAEGDQRAGIPGVEHIRVTAQGLAGRLGLRIGLVAGHVHLAVFVVPGGYLVAPPQLAADAPVLDVVHPLVVGVDPVLRYESHFARLHSVDGFLGNGFAGSVLVTHLGHGHKPLVGQHGFDHLAGAGANRQHQLVRFDLQQKALRVQIGQQRLAGHKPVQALVGQWSVVVDLGVQGEDRDQRQVMPLGAGIVVKVVGAGDLDATRAKGAVYKVVGNDGDLAVAQGQVHHFSDQVFVAVVFRVHRQRTVCHHRLWPGGRNRHALAEHAVHQLRAIGKRVQDVVHLALSLGAFHLQIAYRALQYRVPVDQALSAVNQALLKQAHKSFGHRPGQLGVHGEVFAAPVHTVAHAAHLGGDGVAAVFLPLPHLFQKRFAPEVVSADLLFLQLAFHHDLGGNTGVVGTGNPGGIEAAHAVVARQAVHDGLVERMPHVQRAGDIWRRQLNTEGWCIGLRRLRAAEAGYAVAPLFPLRSPMRLQRCGFKGFGQAVEAGLMQSVGHGGTK